MTPFDLILFWLSEQGHVSMTKLARNCLLMESLQQRDSAVSRHWRFPRRIANVLWRLGHVERTSRGGWQIVPPTLVSQSDRFATWYGARTPGLLRQLEECGMQVQCHVQLNAPEVWQVSDDGDLLSSLGTNVSFRVTTDRGSDLLRALPSFDDIRRSWPKESPPAGLTWERWNETDGNHNHWSPCSTPNAGDGIYRSQLRKPPLYYFNSGDHRLVKLPPDHVSRVAAKWHVCRHQSRLHYSTAESQLSIPSRLDLPVLVERALNLASGWIPSWERDGRRHYRGIDLRRAQQVSRITGMQLIVNDTNS